jgi:RND family efflux transporter MFP subunit
VPNQRARAVLSSSRLSQLARWLLPVAMTVLFTLVLAPDFAIRRAREAPVPGAAAARSSGLPLRTAASAPHGAELPRADEIAAPEPEAADPVDLARIEDEAAEPAARDPAPGGSGDELGSLDCIIEPYELIKLGSAVPGVLGTLHVERGDPIEPGQVVAELESSVEKAMVEVARARAEMEGALRAREARLAFGERRKERAGLLFERRAVSLDEREATETEAQLARLELREARENQELASLELEQALAALARRSVRSPISGVVVERFRSAGEVIDQEPILSIAKLDPLRVEVILPSALFGSVRPGMRAAVIPEAPGDRVHVASVTIVDRVLDAASGTFGVRLELPNRDHAIPGGLHCQVRFLRD